MKAVIIFLVLIAAATGYAQEADIDTSNTPGNDSNAELNGSDSTGNNSGDHTMNDSSGVSGNGQNKNNGENQFPRTEVYLSAEGNIQGVLSNSSSETRFSKFLPVAFFLGWSDS